MIIKTSISSKLPCLVVIFTAILFSSKNSVTTQNVLSRQKSVSVEDGEAILTSPNKDLTFGFYGMGENAYWLSVWFTNSRDRSIVWMANRDRPVNGKGSRVILRRDGAFVLSDVDGLIIWGTNTSSTDARTVRLLNTGNLVLEDSRGNVLWQSFDFPTDTLLPHQLFRKSSSLVSSLGRGNFGSGYFRFFFDENNVLTLMYDGSEISSIYWPNPDYRPFQSGRTTYNSSRIAFFDEFGNFSSSDRLQFSASDYGSGLLRRLTLDSDGNLRLYSLRNETGLWVVTWQALLEPCKVHGICGRNGICVYRVRPMCSCPPGFEVADPGSWGEGCRPTFKRSCSKSQPVKFVQLPYVDFYGFDLSYTENMSLDSCIKLCSEDCQCVAITYRMNGDRVCFAKSALFNGYWSPSFPGSVYLKLPADVNTTGAAIPRAANPECGSTSSALLLGSPSMYDTMPKRVKWPYLYWFAFSIGILEILCVISGWWLLYGKHGAPTSVEDGYQMITSQFRQFSYAELKKATKKFREELGKGASGAVYKGILSDKREVAVKILGGMIQGEGDFWAEVSTIGKINHINLVRMWGLCSEGRHRLLVYEYMEYKSLDKHLFSPSFMKWEDRFKVALGTAKGLAYLHHHCLEWIIHCDVKPENILLDREYEPKIADFGLAKLFQRTGNSTEFSQIRGTKGYMAPEWALNLPITAKVDVYSYGVVILELVRGVRMSNCIAEEGIEQETELTRFIRVVKDDVQHGKESWIDMLVDLRLEGEFNRRQLIAIVEVGIACVEEDRNKRPAMDSVVQVLLGCEDTMPSPLF